MNLVHQFQAGGLFMYFILFFGLLSFGIIIERSISLYFKFKNVDADFRKNIFSLVSKGNYQDAVDYIDSTHQTSLIAKICRIGIALKANGAGEEEVQARMDEVLQKELTSVDKRTAYLSVFGNVCTLFGLLGTVTGLIASFAGVASATPMERAALLSHGISEALNTTAFGLLMAIPALLGFAFLQSRTDSVMSTITQETTQVYHDLLFSNNSPSVSKVDVKKEKAHKNTSANMDV